MKMTLADFLNVTKVIRMLYGVQVADHYFRQNLEEMTGSTVKDLQQLIERVNV